MGRRKIYFRIKRLCACGCREEVNGYNYTKHEPQKYKHGHHSRGKFKTNSIRMRIETCDIISCECGCGELIPSINKNGEPAKFKSGHNRRGKVHPNSIRWREQNNRWKGGRYITMAGYVMVLKPDHPEADCRGYIAEHRLVMDQKLGRLLRPDEHIHHINGNKQNNSPENLQLVSNSEHWYIHHPRV